MAGQLTFDEEKRAILELANEEEQEEEDLFGIPVPKLTEALRMASPEVLNDQDVARASLVRSGLLLRYFGDGIRADFDLVHLAIQNHGLALEFASDSLRGNREVVLEASKSDSFALAFASDAIRADREVVLDAVRRNGRSLLCASDELRGDLSVVLEAVKESGSAFGYASEALRSDKDTVMKVVNRNHDAFTWADLKFRDDQDLVLLATRCCPHEGELDFMSHYTQAGGTWQMHIHWTKFKQTASAVVAVTGQEAPVLSVAVTHMLAEGAEIAPSQGEQSPAPAGKFLCEVALMSGHTFDLELPDAAYTDGFGQRRPSPIVNDLAIAAVAEVAKRAAETSDTKTAKCVFLSFDMGDGESRLASAWDWDRPLAEFARRSVLLPGDGKPCVRSDVA